MQLRKFINPAINPIEIIDGEEKVIYTSEVPIDFYLQLPIGYFSEVLETRQNDALRESFVEAAKKDKVLVDRFTRKPLALKTKKDEIIDAGLKELPGFASGSSYQAFEHFPQDTTKSTFYFVGLATHPGAPDLICFAKSKQSVKQIIDAAHSGLGSSNSAVDHYKVWHWFYTSNLNDFMPSLMENLVKHPLFSEVNFLSWSGKKLSTDYDMFREIFQLPLSVFKTLASYYEDEDVVQTFTSSSYINGKLLREEKEKEMMQVSRLRAADEEAFRARKKPKAMELQGYAEDKMQNLSSKYEPTTMTDPSGTASGLRDINDRDHHLVLSLSYLCMRNDPKNKFAELLLKDPEKAGMILEKLYAHLLKKILEKPRAMINFLSIMKKFLDNQTQVLNDTHVLRFVLTKLNIDISPYMQKAAEARKLKPVK